MLFDRHNPLGKLKHPELMLGLALAIGFPYSGGYSEEFVRANAGITPGVTPGYDPAETPGLTTATTATISGAIVVAARTDMNTTNFPGMTGTGNSEADPYVISNKLFDTAGLAVTFSDATAEVYWVKFVDCDWSGNPTGCLSIVEMAGGVTTQHNRWNNASQTQDAHVKVTIGTYRSRYDLISALSSDNWVLKDGANAVVDLQDFSVSSAVGYGYVLGLFRNTAAGGSFSFQRYTLAGASWSGPLCWFTQPTTLTIERGDVNTNDAAGFASVLPLSQSVLLAAWTLPVLIRDNRVRCGTISSNSAIIGMTDNSNAATRSIRNLTVEHNHIMAAAGRLSGVKMLCLGLSSNTDVNHTRDCSFRFNRIARDPTQVVAGNEVMFFYRTGPGFVVEGNWVDECGEDAYEFQQPLQGVVCRYNGGGEEGGSGKVGGNMVDFWCGGGYTAWDAADGNLGGHQCHHIWGTCGGDAVIVDSMNGVTVDLPTIDVDNADGGFVANPPAARVRLHVRLTNGLDGVTVNAPSVDMSAGAFGGYPCLLTREMATGVTGQATVQGGGAVATDTVITLDDATGFTANDLIMVTLNTTSIDGTPYKHYTTQVGAPAGNVITIADALPVDATAGNAVERVNAYNAGTVSWPQWNGVSWDIRDGTGGVVDGM